MIGRERLTLISADEARARFTSFGAPAGPERVGLLDADGRVLAGEVRAPHDAPPWARSTMDGFAVRADEVAGAREDAPVRLRVAGEVLMGQVLEGELAPGVAAAISTGGVVPDALDAVVMVEWTTRDGDDVLVSRPVRAWENVVRPGDDLRAGDPLIAAGRRLRAVDVGALASFGITHVDVFRTPRVAIVSTGNEIVPFDAPAKPGQVRCMNQHALAAQVRRAGGTPVAGGIVVDDLGAIRARVEELLPSSELVLLTGGSSVGVKDLTVPVLEALGAEIVLHGIDVRPGKPTVLARKGTTPIVGLPGVPVSAMMIFDQFVRPLLWRLAGERGRDPWPVKRPGVLASAVKSSVGREDYVRVRFGEDGRVEPLVGGSAILSALLRADGIVIVPAAVEGLAAGADVTVLAVE